jgi:uncharacterized protein (TIGR00645 family)
VVVACERGGSQSKVGDGLIGISSIHLLKTFINVSGEPKTDNYAVMWQVIIHVTVVFSAIALGWIDRLTYRADEKVAR